MEEPERHELLLIARRALTRAVAEGRPLSFGEENRGEAKNKGAFVSLHTRGWGIRGCVGCLESDRPIEATVAEMAGAAALRDPRFPPVRVDELDELIIEISVLSPVEEIDSIDELEIGRDGLLVVGRNRRGVLLPQVAEERDWDARTFAAQTCIKAQLEPDAWLEDDVRLYKFVAEVFSED